MTGTTCHCKQDTYVESSSTPDQPDPARRCEQPGQACSQTLLERSSAEGPLLREMERHHPACVIERPVDNAAMLSDGRAQKVTQGTVHSREVDTGLAVGDGEI